MKNMNKAVSIVDAIVNRKKYVFMVIMTWMGASTYILFKALNECEADVFIIYLTD